MSERLPAEVEAVLRENGWTPDQDRTDQVQAVVEVVTAQVGARGARHEVFPAAVNALREFGGVYVVQDGPGVDLRRRPFAVDPAMASPSAETLADVAGALGTRLFPLGVEGDVASLLAVDEQGRVFAVDETGEWFLGDSLGVAITTLVLGTQPPRVRDDGTWERPPAGRSE